MPGDSLRSGWQSGRLCDWLWVDGQVAAAVDRETSILVVWGPHTMNAVEWGHAPAPQEARTIAEQKARRHGWDVAVE